MYNNQPLPPSNILHLVLFFSQVTACLSSYYELRPCRPRTEKLKQLLSECLYQGPEYESALPMEDQEGEEEDEVEEERGEGSVWDQKKLHKTEKKESVKTLPIKVGDIGV